MARNFTRGRGRLGARRETQWVAIAETQTALAGANSALLFTGLTAALLGMRPFTIIRTRGVMHIRSDNVAADETYGGGLSFAVVSDQALAIGVTAVPTPMTDRDSDLFFVFEEMYSRQEVFTSVGVESTVGEFKEWDSKGARKVEEGQDVAIVIEAGSLSSGVTMIKAGRMLIKLH